MNLQELSYLEVYNHVFQEIKKKEEAQIKLRKWWYFVNNNKDIVIIRTCKSNDSFKFNLNSVMYSNELTLIITGLDLARELHITFTSSKQKKTYLLNLMLRSQYLFKIYIRDMFEYIPDGVCLQIFE